MSSNQAPIVDRIRIIPRPDDFLDRNVGSSGEVFFNKVTNSLRVYSGKVAGGFELAKTDLSNISNTTFANKIAEAGGSTGGGSASLEVSLTPPEDAANGSLWFNLENARLYVYVDDGTTTSWIQPAVPIGGGGSSSFAAITVGDSSELIANGADTLIFAEGSGISITADPDTNTITFGSTGIDSLSGLGSISLNLGATINEFSTDITLADQSNTAIPTEQAVKSYVDTSLTLYAELTGAEFTGTVAVSTSAVGNALEVIYNDTTVANLTTEGDFTAPTVTVEEDLFASRTYESITTINAATGVIALNQTAYETVFYFTNPASNFTPNFDNIDTTQDRTISYALIIDQGTTAYMPTACQVSNSPKTIKWLNAGGAPTGNANQVDIVSFTIMIVNGSVEHVFASAASYG